jgi:hypothetical protein
MIYILNVTRYLPSLTHRLNEAKVRLLLNSIKLYAMKIGQGVKVWLHAFLTSALDESEFMHWPLYPQVN